MSLDQFLMLLGFSIAAYSIVANDAIQTLGTFLSSNAKQPWWLLWLYAVGILYAVLIYGWVSSGGDASYGRLARIPLPQPFSWVYVVPPLVLLALTRRGIPVSTTFLILTIFAPENLASMLVKSIAGYAVAFVFAIVLYLMVARTVEQRFIDTVNDTPPRRWIALQWISTGFLWTQWLVQDLANIFVYVPRRLDASWMAFALVVMALLHAYIFWSRGGEIQKVVTSKTNTADIRSATIIDFCFGLVLMLFKEWSKIPMSTTWVFLGLLAGREIAMSIQLQARPMRETLGMVRRDGVKVLTGLAVSVVLALGLPMVAQWMAAAAPTSVQAQAPAARPSVAADR